MVYTFLFKIVFIAQVIITISIIQLLLKVDAKVKKTNYLIEKYKSSIKEISQLINKISGQIKILVEDYVTNFKEKQEEMFIRQLLKSIVGVLLIKSNIKLINNFRKTKIAKILGKGLSLLEIMV